MTKGMVTLGELDAMSLDDVDDMNIVLNAEEAAIERLRRRRAAKDRR